MTIDREENILEINGKSFKIEEYENFYHFETDLKELTDLKINSGDLEDKLQGEDE